MRAFTTGSTGKKKGVMLAQKNMMALCASAEFAYDGVRFDKGMAPVPNYPFDEAWIYHFHVHRNGIEQYITSNTKRTLKDIHEQKPAFIQLCLWFWRLCAIFWKMILQREQ